MRQPTAVRSTTWTPTAAAVAEPAVLVIDQGTTATAVCLVDRRGDIVAQADQEFRQYYPQPGWVEHIPADIWASVQSGLQAVLQQTAGRYHPIALGITNQRETTVLWERATGKPLAPAIVWQDRRTAGACDELRRSGAETMVRERTGLLLDPYFSATKIAWLLEAIPNARRRAESGELAVGTIDTWLIWQLTGGARHLTDRTNACRTLLYSLQSEGWDDELCRLFKIPPALLPTVVPSYSEAATTAASATAGLTVPICGIAGDQQAALFGQTCLADGQAKNTYGTGCFLLVQTGERRVVSQAHLLTTAAIGADAAGAPMPTYALEGSVFVAGAAVQWLRDELGLIATAADSETVASAVPDSGGVYVVPAFTGLGAPYWDPYARGAIVGLTRGSGRSAIVRATLESIAYQTCDLVRAIGQDGVSLHALRVDGGASANNLLMQTQADLLGIPIERGVIGETTSLGAAFLAGIGGGLWSSTRELANTWRLDRRFLPQITTAERAARYAGWQRAVERARGRR
ncbi:MAG: glycerol kinase GlpK [Chloroflexota bacterium]